VRRDSTGVNLEGVKPFRLTCERPVLRSGDPVGLSLDVTVAASVSIAKSDRSEKDHEL
jgi:hypothetical protein